MNFDRYSSTQHWITVMSNTVELPYYTIKAETLALWLDGQPELWWNVDGDPLLTSHVDFSCPSEELSAELRRIGKPLRLFDPREAPEARGEAVPVDELNDLADTHNNSKARTFLLSWEGDDIQWLLSEDPDAAKAGA